MMMVIWMVHRPVLSGSFTDVVGGPVKPCPGKGERGKWGMGREMGLGTNW